ncbi:unnamed protein product [Arctia plantaginis]|uniref:Uncharacterized protein n=1 Tax=Arctia plantaginis TaxID=874455 RepID=A0A8S1BDQ5_ARCPL|nr:unnamed protein product [Arctia plantaginis]
MFVVKLILSHLVCASRPVEQLFIHSGWNARSLVACLDRPSPPAARQKVCDPALSAANYVDVPRVRFASLSARSAAVRRGGLVAETHQHLRDDVTPDAAVRADQGQ